jgi:hypothetical protein
MFIVRTEEKAITRGRQQWIALILACAVTAGCLLNSVHPIAAAPRTKPDKAHAIIVIGIGLDVAWPYTGFPVTLAEYSAKKQQLTANCFHYNRIEVTVPSTPAKVKYFAFEVPANTYVYLALNPKATLAPPSSATAFIWPPGGTVYIGDYVFVGNAVEFRQDIEAARIGAHALIPRGVTLDAAVPTTAPNARMLICTP